MKCCFPRPFRKYHVLYINYIILHQKRKLDVCGGYHNTYITIYSNLSLANLFQTRLYILPTYLSTKMTCSQKQYVVRFLFCCHTFRSSVYIKRHQVSLEASSLSQKTLALSLMSSVLVFVHALESLAWEVILCGIRFPQGKMRNWRFRVPFGHIWKTLCGSGGGRN